MIYTTLNTHYRYKVIWLTSEDFAFGGHYWGEPNWWGSFIDQSDLHWGD